MAVDVHGERLRVMHRKRQGVGALPAESTKRKKKESPKIVQEAPLTASDGPKRGNATSHSEPSAPSGPPRPPAVPQEAPKRPKRGPNKPPNSPQEAPRGFTKWLQEAPEKHAKRTQTGIPEASDPQPRHGGGMSRRPVNEQTNSLVKGASLCSHAYRRR